MADTRAKGGGAVTKGLNPQVLAEEDFEDPGGTGGSSGGGTHAGRGDPSGGTLSTTGAGAREPGEAPPSLDEASDEEIAQEASALGNVNGTLPDSTHDTPPAPRQSGPAGGEAVDAGAGRGTVGSGPSRDRSGLGGGGPLGQHGGAGPASSD